MAKKSGADQPRQNPIVENPTNAAEFAERGWSHYSKKEFFRAEADFRKSLEISPNQPDYLYALGMTLQASGRPQDAVQSFERVIQLIDNPSEENRVRFYMLTRLAKGHINRIKTGEWRLDVS
jgi:tetratricopeptide (TPR) repeat protein